MSHKQTPLGNILTLISSENYFNRCPQCENKIRGISKFKFWTDAIVDINKDSLKIHPDEFEELKSHLGIIIEFVCPLCNTNSIIKLSFKDLFKMYDKSIKTNVKNNTFIIMEMDYKPISSGITINPKSDLVN